MTVIAQLSPKSSAEAWFNAMTIPEASANSDEFRRKPSSDSLPSVLPNSSNTLIIFDWDDTLLCTSALKGRSSFTSSELAALGEQVLSLLELAESLGTVVIVTSSSRNWVEWSAATYLPMLLPIVVRTPIIYAREEYSRLFPYSSSQWKLQTFLELQRLNAESITNVVVIGDSQDEMQASSMLGERWPGILVKQVKFSAFPTTLELMQQLKVLSFELRSVAEAAECIKRDMLEPWIDEAHDVNREICSI
mmetsp:Transcript_63660/g.138657  ORF Transcript_63660/g.138657 Transcript_63660/m.138657 type:complete len:249 (-) Transcript_63660:378-1124(-)|eukprot:CAMPEP_0170582974 /NCGR_PEP_ID=MMETSP0224-20130122/7876_1 /TAXON_ID=285029 /ORGANISM="Togula jolla, Strain CCCM 725" /LENGTH=248 /DNA_ID=CAMNT_0010906247 /DNA_START=33 /DNA_END=779 /DNA_ORIENTATION=+